MASLFGSQAAPGGSNVPTQAQTQPQVPQTPTQPQVPGGGTNVQVTTEVPIRSYYSAIVHATLLVVTSIAGIFLSEAVTKATADGAKVPPADVKRYLHFVGLYKMVAAPYLAAFFMYHAFPRSSALWCCIRLVYDECNIMLGFTSLVLLTATYSDQKYRMYLTIWLIMVQIVRVAYLAVNQCVNFPGREKPIPYC